MNYRLIDFKVFGDERGNLISLESNKSIPFEIKRVFYMYDTSPEWVRGKHANRKCEQIVIAMDGCCQFVLDDGQGERKEVWLNRPDKGLYIAPKIWNEMHHFSYGCKLMVLASGFYDEKDYIRDYADFLKEIKNGEKA